MIQTMTAVKRHTEPTSKPGRAASAITGIPVSV
jgi:hypothetical protein